MKYKIEDLRNGKCAVINDGTLEELREVLRLAFPKDGDNTSGKYKYYVKNIRCDGGFYPTNKTDLPTQSVKDFLKPSLDDKIKELKEFAKSHGMDCDVVLSEKKMVKVSWDGGNIQDKSFYFIYDKSVEELLIKTGFSKAGEFLAKQLENYLNENH